MGGGEWWQTENSGKIPSVSSSSVAAFTRRAAPCACRSAREPRVDRRPRCRSRQHGRAGGARLSSRGGTSSRSARSLQKEVDPERDGGLTVRAKTSTRGGGLDARRGRAGEQASPQRSASFRSAPPAGALTSIAAAPGPSGMARDADPRSCKGADMEAPEAGRG